MPRLVALYKVIMAVTTTVVIASNNFHQLHCMFLLLTVWLLVSQNSLSLERSHRYLWVAWVRKGIMEKPLRQRMREVESQ